MTDDAVAARLRVLAGWVAEQGLLATPVPQLAAGFSERLVAAGLPLWRAHLSVTTLHPEIEALSLTWYREGSRDLVELPHGAFEQADYQASPIRYAIMQSIARRRERLERGETADTIGFFRFRLERGEGLDTFPLLGEFRAAGATDYLCFLAPFGFDGQIIPDIRSGTVITVTSDRPGGFADGEVAAVAELIPPFAVAVRIGVNMSIMRTVLGTYLGADVARRILDGEIRRGVAEAISAAILFADLRGFTALADRVPRDRLVALLDDYLDCAVRPIEEAGGQVLKFMGDGLLAVFPFDGPGGGSRADTCAHAVAAAETALARTAALNLAREAAGLAVTTLDIALHSGEVLYGNVGSSRRLDFTVIGPAVNEASRIEALCSRLGVALLASWAFVDAAGMPARFRSLGRHPLRGVSEERELFTI